MIEDERTVTGEPRRKPRRGDILELEIHGLDAKGRGVGDAAGASVHIRGAVPGATVRVEVRKRRRGRVEAYLCEVLEPGPHAVPPRCPHVGTCGGCAFQGLAYERQLVELERSVHTALEGVLGDATVHPMLGCEVPWAYRNKMDFTFGARRWVEPEEPQGVDASYALGLHVPGFYKKVLDIRTCAIHFAGADELLTSVRELSRELEPWDVERHTGLMRHLVLRKGMRTGEVMVDLVTSRRAEEEIGVLVAALLERHPEITTVVQNVTTRLSAVAVGEEEFVLHGPGTIREVLCGKTFEISANSFFQTNTEQAERLFEIVREEARLTGSEVLFDLYCGAGTIGLALGDDLRELWGFESVSSSVADARRNAEANGIGAHFVEGDVLEALADTAARPQPDVVVVDPPRAGLHPKVPDAILGLAPRRVVYVSCNVASAARDLPLLRAGGYRLSSVRPVDLFPHTPHLECVFGLERAT